MVCPSLSCVIESFPLSHNGTPKFLVFIIKYVCLFFYSFWFLVYVKKLSINKSWGTGFYLDGSHAAPTKCFLSGKSRHIIVAKEGYEYDTSYFIFCWCPPRFSYKIYIVWFYLHVVFHPSWVNSCILFKIEPQFPSYWFEIPSLWYILTCTELHSWILNSFLLILLVCLLAFVYS